MLKLEIDGVRCEVCNASLRIGFEGNPEWDSIGRSLYVVPCQKCILAAEKGAIEFSMNITGAKEEEDADL